jgi:hypothetical protein
MHKASFFVMALMATLFMVGCQKEVTEVPPVNPNNPVTVSQVRLLYSDSIFYLKNQPGSYTVLPVSKPSVAGYFKSIPLGLSLDSVSGRINVTQSVSGIRYKIYYLSSATNVPVDSVKIVVSGIDYADGIYEIAKTPNAYDTSFPIYNARPSLLLPCGDDDEDDDGDVDDDDNGCIFDETDLDNDGNDDIAGVNQDKLLVDIKKGTIDVEASYHAGVFGASSNVANGVNKDFTFYYRLQDPSNLALQQITVRLYHYKTKADIPQWLLDELGKRREYNDLVNARGANEAARILSFRAKRPPLIVVVSSY